MLTYGLGMTSPFALAAVRARPFLGWMNRNRKYLVHVEKVMGAMLVLLAVPVVSGSVNAIADFMIRHMPWTTRSTRIRSEEGECPACPASLAVPAFEGNMWVKWPRRIGVYDQEIESREATLNYANRMPDGRAWKWTWVMEAKWVLTSPRPQAPTCHSNGPLLITDLALICYPMTDHPGGRVRSTRREPGFHGVFVTDREGQVAVGYRNLPDGPKREVQALLDEIAREAAGL
ncbi:MAG: hypothetical protein WBC03_03250 [Albidovulum sp.]